jgi:2-dehydropantoate 2-reductase
MGALGILYGHHLTEKLGKDSVYFIMDEPRLQRFNQQPPTCNGEETDFQVLGDPGGAPPADLVIFAVKATDLEKSMETAAPHIGEETILLSLLNGITSEEILGERFGKERVLYCVAQGMDAVKIGHRLTYTKMGHLLVGVPEDEPEKGPLLDEVCRLFDEIRLPYERDPDIRRRIWSKFMLNVGVNQTVMVWEGTYGTIQQPGPAREQMKAAMREVIQLCRCEGIPVTEEDLEYYVALVDTLSPDGMPSMRQDGLARRPSEVEFFAGTVLKLAEKHHLNLPVNQELYNRIKAMESRYVK